MGARHRGASTSSVLIVLCLLLALILASGCGAEKGTDGTKDGGADKGAALSPKNGEKLSFKWDFNYGWSGDEGGQIVWQSDGANNEVPLTAMISSETGTCSIGGEATLPVIVTADIPDGQMTGSGKTDVDVGGTYENGVVKLTIMETTGGSYTITVEGEAVTVPTAPQTLKHEMSFKMSEVNSPVGCTVTQKTENGTVTGRLASLSTPVPLK
ncbi:MAG: hypothetical protein KJ993_17100 [Actinobacteria bacterium]|nr:hypothetical protein [Actinomycetota bacterium]